MLVLCVVAHVAIVITMMTPIAVMTDDDHAVGMTVPIRVAVAVVMTHVAVAVAMMLATELDIEVLREGRRRDGERAHGSDSESKLLHDFSSIGKVQRTHLLSLHIAQCLSGVFVPLAPA
jgi:hypothetical protein